MAGIDANTLLYAQMLGANNGTTFGDSSTYARGNGTANGNAKTSTARELLSGDGSSGLFDGSGDYVKWNGASWMNIGTGAFTIDFDIYPTAWSGSWNYMMNDNNTSTGFSMRYRAGFGLETHIAATYNPFTWVAGTGAKVHVALVREGTGAGQLKAYIDGTAIGVAGTSSDNISACDSFTIGCNPALDGLIGNMAHFRFSNIARWTTNFTPPTSPYTLDVKVPLFMNSYRRRRSS